MSAQPEIVAVGEALMDLIAPDAHDIATASVFERSPGGAPANVAVAASRLGISTALVGAVGDDPFGYDLLRILAGEGVDIDGVRTVSARTTLALVARNTGGIPDFVFYRGADAALRPADIPGDLVAGAQFIHVSSMALLSEPSRSATLAAIDIAQSNGTLVSVDPNLRPSSWPSLAEARRAISPLLRAADVLKLNDEETRLLAGTTDVHEGLPALGRDDALVVTTLGAEGCSWRCGAQSGRVAAPTVQVVDTTGAGDAFAAALLASLCQLMTRPGSVTALEASAIEQSLRFACCAGALACSAVGAMSTLPHRDDVERLVGKSRESR